MASMVPDSQRGQAERARMETERESAKQNRSKHLRWEGPVHSNRTTRQVEKGEGPSPGQRQWSAKAEQNSCGEVDGSTSLKTSWSCEKLLKHLQGKARTHLGWAEESGRYLQLVQESRAGQQTRPCWHPPSLQTSVVRRKCSIAHPSKFFNRQLL